MDVIKTYLSQTCWDEWMKGQKEDHTNKEYLLAEQAMKFGIEKAVACFTEPRRLERKRIATAAMQGMLANEHMRQLARETADELYGPGTCSTYRAVAKAALCFADELMDEADQPFEPDFDGTDPSAL